MPTCSSISTRIIKGWASLGRKVVVAEGAVIFEHRRVIKRSHHGQGRTIYDWRHYLAVIQRKPGALRNDAPFAELPEAIRQL